MADNKYTEIAFTDIHESDLYLITSGRREHSFNHVYTNSLSALIIAYVESGQTLYYVNGRGFPLSSGMVYVIFPDAKCHYDATGSDWTIHWIGIGGGESERLLEALGLSVTSPIMNTQNGENILSAMKELFSLSQESSIYKNKILVKIKLYSLIYELLENCDISEKPSIDYIKETNKFIEYNFANHIKVSDIANALHIDRSYLSRIYREQTGRTIKSEIRERQLNCASVMLAAGKSVGDTAFQCGFSDPLYFSKVYKARFGVLPSKEKNLG